jgi:hypothetical protein
VNGHTVAEELQILEILDKSHDFASLLVFGETDGAQRLQAEETDVETTARPAPTTQSDTSSNLLDDLSEDMATPKPVKASHKSTLSLDFRSKSAETLCELLYHLLRDPKVNITLPALRFYTNTQCLLGKPEYLPEIFHLYASKPLATQSSSNISFKPPSRPWLPRLAVPLPLAELALTTAIHKRDMGLAVAITDTTVATPSYRLRRFLQQAMPKISLLSVVPLTAWTIASWAATYQNTFDPVTAKQMALMGGLAYVGTFGTVGYVAVTTWSDHHDRVHWQVGKPLGRRWLEEDERLFLDRIAQAWGFEERKRRGEEQGEEWEALRDTCGLRGMVLDKTEFLEGMQ